MSIAKLRADQTGPVYCCGHASGCQSCGQRAGTIQNGGGYSPFLWQLITAAKSGAANPRYLKDMIREVHLKLVENKIRHKVNLIFSGGIAMAEHVAKSLICGADAVVY